MSEPLLEHLKRFTPDAGRLDRDVLLFAIGRSSARPNRGWLALTALLAGTQALSLVLLWPHSRPPAASLTEPVLVLSASSAAHGLAAPEASAEPGLWSARRFRPVPESEDRPAGDVTFIDRGPPLRAHLPRPSLLD
jgi:hypothetical protein